MHVSKLATAEDTEVAELPFLEQLRGLSVLGGGELAFRNQL